MKRDPGIGNQICVGKAQRSVSRHVLRSAAAAAVLWSLACTKDTVAFEERTETCIGGAMLEAKSAGGELTIYFDDDSLPECTMVTITTIRDPIDDGRIGPVFEISAPQQPISPVPIEIKNPEVDLQVNMADFDGLPRRIQSSSYDPQSHIARVEDGDLGWYGLLAADLSIAEPQIGCENVRPHTPGTNARCVEPDKRCGFSGQECCCGFCTPYIVCVCFRGAWSCAYGDRCLAGEAACPGVDGGHDAGVEEDGAGDDIDADLDDIDGDYDLGLDPDAGTTPDGGFTFDL